MGGLSAPLKLRVKNTCEAGFFGVFSETLRGHQATMVMY